MLRSLPPQKTLTHSLSPPLKPSFDINRNLSSRHLLPELSFRSHGRPSFENIIEPLPADSIPV